MLKLSSGDVEKVKIVVIGHAVYNEVTYYILVVSQGNDRRKVRHRFNKIRQFHDSFLNESGVSPPSKHVLSFNTQKLTFIKKREKELQRYFDRICSLPNITSSPEFTQFYGLDITLKKSSKTPLPQTAPSEPSPGVKRPLPPSLVSNTPNPSQEYNSDEETFGNVEDTTEENALMKKKDEAEEALKKKSENANAEEENFGISESTIVGENSTEKKGAGMGLEEIGIAKSITGGKEGQLEDEIQVVEENGEIQEENKKIDVAGNNDEVEEEIVQKEHIEEETKGGDVEKQENSQPMFLVNEGEVKSEVETVVDNSKKVMDTDTEISVVKNDETVEKSVEEKGGEMKDENNDREETLEENVQEEVVAKEINIGNEFIDSSVNDNDDVLSPPMPIPPRFRSATTDAALLTIGKHIEKVGGTDVPISGVSYFDVVRILKKLEEENENLLKKNEELTEHLRALEEIEEENEVMHIKVENLAEQNQQLLSDVAEMEEDLQSLQQEKNQELKEKEEEISNMAEYLKKVRGEVARRRSSIVGLRKKSESGNRGRTFSTMNKQEQIDHVLDHGGDITQLKDISVDDLLK